jgi:hypothetical protein
LTGAHNEGALRAERASGVARAVIAPEPALLGTADEWLAKGLLIEQRAEATEDVADPG